MNNGWVSHFKFSRVAIICGLLLTIGGCGDTATSSNTVDTTTYLFYSPVESTVAFDTGGNYFPWGLKAVDPAYPSTPITLFPTSTINNGTTDAGAGHVSPFKPTVFLAGTVNSGSQTISDLHYRYVMFTDGTSLYRIDAEKNGGLGITAVSNESEIIGSTTGPTPGICFSDSQDTFAWAITDYANPLDSVFIYRKDLDGANDCATSPVNPAGDTLNIVQLKDSSMTPPNSTFVTSASEPVVAAYNTDGSIASILMWSQYGNTLTRYSVDMAWQQTILSGLAAGIRPQVLGIDGQGRILLSVRGGPDGIGTHIYQFDPATNILSVSLYNDPTNSVRPYAASDGTYAYFHDNQKIYRVPYDASAYATTLVDEAPNFGTGRIRAGWTYTFFTTTYNPVPDLHLSGNKLVYIYDDSTGIGGAGGIYVRSIPKSGGTASTILTAPDNSELLSWRAAFGRVYLSRYDVKSATSVGDGGESPNTYNQSWWMGFTFESTARLFAADFTSDPKRRVRDLTPRSIFRAQYNPSTGDPPADLISYDANTTSQLIDFGVPAATFGSYQLGGPPDILGLATSDRTLIAYDGSAGSTAVGTDILYLHARNKSTMTVAERDNPDSAALVGINNGGGCSFGNGRFDPLLPALILLSAVYLWRRRKSWRTNR